MLTKPLSLPISKSIDLIDGFKDICYSDKHKWILAIAYRDIYIREIFVYDLKTDSWYIFKVDSYASQYTCIIEKEIGTYKGTFILSDDTNGYLHFYDETSDRDFSEFEYLLDEYGEVLTDEYDNPLVSEISETYIDISPTLRTKTFTLDDQITLVRLREMFADYKKRNNQNIVIKIENPDTEEYRVYTDTENSTYSSRYKSPRKITDGLSGNLKYCNKLYIEASGAGLDELNGLKLVYRDVMRRRRV
jgi:hypothetical protein